MREDMFKVIVERPRRGRAWARPLRTPRDDRTWMPVSRGRGQKGLNENLEPLRRYLRSSIGKPWNAVYSDLCKGLSVRSAVQKHVRDHLRDLVALQVTETFGVLWQHSRFHQLVRLERTHRDQLYVCPRTGLLRLLEASPHRQRRERQSRITWLSADQAALVFRDQWWLVDVTEARGPVNWDVLLERQVHGSWQLRRLYQKEAVAGVRKRALTRAEVKRLALQR